MTPANHNTRAAATHVIPTVMINTTAITTPLIPCTYLAVAYIRNRVEKSALYNWKTRYSQGCRRRKDWKTISRGSRMSAMQRKVRNATYSLRTGQQRPSTMITGYDLPREVAKGARIIHHGV